MNLPLPRGRLVGGWWCCCCWWGWGWGGPVFWACLNAFKHWEQLGLRGYKSRAGYWRSSSVISRLEPLTQQQAPGVWGSLRLKREKAGEAKGARMPRVRNQSLGLADPNTEHVDRRRHLHDECHHAGNARLRRRGGRSQHGVGARFRGAPRASRAQPIPCRPKHGTRGSAASSSRRVPPRWKCEAAVAGAAPAARDRSTDVVTQSARRRVRRYEERKRKPSYGEHNVR